MARVTRRGQVTIPKDVREKLGLREGTEVEFYIEDDTLQLRKVNLAKAIDRWTGVLQLPTEVDEYMRDLRGQR